MALNFPFILHSLCILLSRKKAVLRKPRHAHDYQEKVVTLQFRDRTRWNISVARFKYNSFRIALRFCTNFRWFFSANKKHYWILLWTKHHLRVNWSSSINIIFFVLEQVKSLLQNKHLPITPACAPNWGTMNRRGFHDENILCKDAPS